MLNHIHKRGNPLFPKRCLILSPLTSLIFTKPSVSAAKADSDDEPSSTADALLSNPIDKVREILIGSASKDLLCRHWFRTLVPTLSSLQVDQIIATLAVEDPHSAIDFFNLLRNEYGFRHSRVSQFVFAHALAEKRRLKELRSFLQPVLQEEGATLNSYAYAGRLEPQNFPKKLKKRKTLKVFNLFQSNFIACHFCITSTPTFDIFLNFFGNLNTYV